ncbi:MAG: DMT family transporter [Planctomycetaceae bacterium]
MSTPSSTTVVKPNTHFATTLWPDASLVGVALIWGINIPVMKTGLDQCDPFVFNAIRLLISAIVLAAFALRERRRGILPRHGIRRRHVLIFGILIGGLYQVLFLLGIDRTTAGNAGLIMATVPAWTAVLARIFIGEKLLRLAWGGLLLALVGTVIVALQKNDLSSGRDHSIGNCIILGSAFAWAAGTVYSRPLLKKISPMQLSASAALIALPVHLLMAVVAYEKNVLNLHSINLWLIIFYAGVLSSGLALPMWNFGVQHAGAAHAAVIQNLVPLIAIAAAWLSRGEAATTTQLFGGALILGGLIIMRMARQRKVIAHPH